MPIDYNTSVQQNELLVWHALEETSFFELALTLTPLQQHSLRHQYRHVQAKRDWLASRYALQLLCGQPCSCFYKDTAGKLRVPNTPFYYSLSHSGNFVASAQSIKAVGIDVQIPSAKLAHIAPKYIVPEVLNMLQQQPEHYLDYLHFYWGIKEAIFKAYGRGQVKYKEHLHLIPFSANNEGYTLARLQKPQTEQWYKIFYKKTANYYLCAAFALED
jgi:phosphopantetheinyl transferase